MITFGDQIEFQDFAEKFAEYFNIKSGAWLSFILNFLFPHYILYFCSCLVSCSEFLCSLSHAAKCLLQQLSAFCFQPMPSNQPDCKTAGLSVHPYCFSCFSLDWYLREDSSFTASLRFFLKSDIVRTVPPGPRTEVPAIPKSAERTKLDTPAPHMEGGCAVTPQMPMCLQGMKCRECKL